MAEAYQEMLRVMSLTSFSEGNQSYLKIATKNYHGEDLTEALQMFLGKRLTTEEISNVARQVPTAM